MRFFAKREGERDWEKEREREKERVQNVNYAAMIIQAKARKKARKLCS